MQDSPDVSTPRPSAHYKDTGTSRSSSQNSGDWKPSESARVWVPPLSIPRSRVAGDEPARELPIPDINYTWRLENTSTPKEQGPLTESVMATYNANESIYVSNTDGRAVPSNLQGLSNLQKTSSATETVIYGMEISAFAQHARALIIPDQTIPWLSRGPTKIRNPGSRSHSRTEKRVLDGEVNSGSYRNAFFSHSGEANIKETIEHLNNTSCWQKVVAGLEHHTDAVFHYASQLI
ncbi:hypothetical protein V8E51_001653 [Hyaloscypha variabilis]